MVSPALYCGLGLWYMVESDSMFLTIHVDRKQLLHYDCITPSAQRCIIPYQDLVRPSHMQASLTVRYHTHQAGWDKLQVVRVRSTCLTLLLEEHGANGSYVSVGDSALTQVYIGHFKRPSLSHFSGWAKCASMEGTSQL